MVARQDAPITEVMPYSPPWPEARPINSHAPRPSTCTCTSGFQSKLFAWHAVLLNWRCRRPGNEASLHRLYNPFVLWPHIVTLWPYWSNFCLEGDFVLFQALQLSKFLCRGHGRGRRSSLWRRTTSAWHQPTWSKHKVLPSIHLKYGEQRSGDIVCLL